MTYTIVFLNRPFLSPLTDERWTCLPCASHLCQGAQDGNGSLHTGVRTCSVDERYDVPEFPDFALDWADDAADSARMLRLDIPSIGDSIDGVGAEARALARPTRISLASS